jgi:hypothetical protein
MSIAKEAYRFCDSFESELLLELMLRFWKHPLAEDKDYRNNLIESAADVLRTSIEGTKLIERVPPHDMNFVAAVWYAEWAGLEGGWNELPRKTQVLRQDWLDAVRRALPSCFCEQGDLGT